jgi:hypothetical protein
MGNAAPLFKPGASNAAAKMYGTPLERQMSMPKSPLGFKDQTGDGKITQADVIKARTEGYSESPLDLHKPGHVEPRGPRIGKEISKKMSKKLTEKPKVPVVENSMRGFGVTKDGKKVDLGKITSTEITETDFKQR